MTTPKTKLAGLALIVALCVGFTLGLTACTGERARTGAETPPAKVDFNPGVAAYKQGDYATAVRQWRPLAEQGYGDAQYNLGNLYRDGRGVPQDYAEAVKWYSKAAEQGNAEAQYNLGLMYRKGRGVPWDDAEALQWYRKAAEQGYAKAQHNLGVMYRKGRGVPQDDAEAVKWYSKAAEQGDAFAQFNLAFMYKNGQGVPQDYAQAHMWYNLAASSFPPGAKRDKAVKNRGIVAEKMTPAQISEAEKLAREWKPK